MIFLIFIGFAVSGKDNSTWSTRSPQTWVPVFFVYFKQVTHSLVPSTHVSLWVADTAPNTVSFTSLPSHAVLFNLICYKMGESSDILAIWHGNQDASWILSSKYVLTKLFFLIKVMQRSYIYVPSHPFCLQTPVFVKTAFTKSCTSEFILFYCRFCSKMYFSSYFPLLLIKWFWALSSKTFSCQFSLYHDTSSCLTLVNR